MFEQVGYIILAVLSGTLASFLMAKFMLSDEKIMNKLDMILGNVVNDVEMQKKVYLLGTLLGSGIAKGSGIQVGSGKFKLEDVIAQGASQFIGNMFRQPIQKQEQGALP
jgi:hypothetical protein